MKFLLISPKNRTVYNFRGDLIRTIQEKGYEVLVTGPDRTDIERIEALGVRFAEIPMNKTGTSPISDLRYCFRLYKLIRREKPDAVLGYTVKPVIYGSIAARMAGVKNISGMVTGGGYTFTAKTPKARLLGVIVRMLYRVGFHCADHVIFQNGDDLDEFCSRGLVKKEICSVVNGSGVNMETFQPEALPKEPVFFMLSRLLRSKGVTEYLKAAKLVKRQYPSAQFYLLGKYETSMQDAIPQEEVEQYIGEGIIRRFDETDDVRQYYRMCSTYVLPSYREGTPRTVLEAMAMGRPVITTDTNGCRETVIDGVNGFLVPVGDVSILADRMKQLMEHPELAAAMGEESLRLCREKFEVGKVNTSMLHVMGIGDREDQGDSSDL